MISLLFILTLLTQSGSPPPQAPMKQNRAPVQAQPAPMQQPSSAEVDRLFALAAMQGSNAEIDMAELALKRGSADEVKAYAGKMISEHKGMMEELMPVLHRILANPPAERLAPADQLAMHHLESIKPVDFDQAYVMQQIGGHLATLTAFQTEADNGTDPQLKEVVRKWTPTIQAHLELAVDTAKHVGGASPFKQ
jgi:putative membrane protein